MLPELNWHSFASKILQGSQFGLSEILLHLDIDQEAGTGSGGFHSHSKKNSHKVLKPKAPQNLSLIHI